MKLLLLASLPLLLLGAAPPVKEVPIGQFVTWGGRWKAPLRFRSGGIEVSVVALPCPARPVGDGGGSLIGGHRGWG